VVKPGVAGGLMDINYAFAGIVVANRDRAADWYEQLLGRPPTFLPNDAEAVWQLADTASIYLFADPTRAGHSVTALAVDDLDATIVELAGRGITVGAIKEIQGTGRKSVVTDPDGNWVSLLEIPGSRNIGS
jgi:predicted enzyme related to lactoylglutathione lyase